jgi:nitroreductase
MKASLQTLLTAATRAPSGDNMQPWRFMVDEAAGVITYFVDETRDPSPMNVNQLMARVAIGAGVENLLRTARINGWTVNLEESQPPAVARVSLPNVSEDAGVIENAIGARVTNRRFYDGRAIPSEVHRRLTVATPPLEGVVTNWIIDRDRLTDLADLMGRSDALLFSQRSMRAAFLANIRFDQMPDADVEIGLPLASLEVSRGERMALRLLPWIPNFLVKWSAHSIFGSHARKLVEGASGLCLIVAPDHDESTYLLVGRAMQRAWLALTEAGIAVQPMMSMPVLETIARFASPELLASIGREKLAALAEDSRRLAPEIGAGRPGFLLRFGFAASPSGRTGRLPWHVSLK